LHDAHIRFALQHNADAICEKPLVLNPWNVDALEEIEKESGLLFNNDFFCGYSPEPINPGDKEHWLPTIKKVKSGSTPEVVEEVDNLYREIITARTHKASSNKVAETAKVIWKFAARCKHCFYK